MDSRAFTEHWIGNLMAAESSIKMAIATGKIWVPEWKEMGQRAGDLQAALVLVREVRKQVENREAVNINEWYLFKTDKTRGMRKYIQRTKAAPGNARLAFNVYAKSQGDSRPFRL